MTELGLELKKARETRELSLEQIAVRTHISKKYLIALEDGEFKVFPGEVYLKGALRKYAEEVGLDPAQAENWYKMESGRAENTPAAEPQAPVKIVKTRQKRAALPLLILLIAVLALFLAARFVYIALSSRPAPPRDPATELLPPPESPPEQETPEPPGPKPITLEREIMPGGVRFLVSGANELEAQLSFAGRCWISLTADGQTVKEETFSAGSGFSISAKKKITVRVGYPPALILVVAGEKVELPDSGNPNNIEILLLD